MKLVCAVNAVENDESTYQKEKEVLSCIVSKLLVRFEYNFGFMVRPIPSIFSFEEKIKKIIHEESGI